LRHLRIKKQKEKQQRKQRREREKHSMGWVLSSALPRAARVLESGYIIVGGRPTAAPRSSNPRAHGVETWSRARRRRAAAYCRSRPCPGSRDGGAERRVLPGRSVAGERGRRRRRAPRYEVVSSMPARLPAAGMGCLPPSPSCPIYSLGSEAMAARSLSHPEFAAFVEDLPAG
jgi:hypothetical protein